MSVPNPFGGDLIGLAGGASITGFAGTATNALLSSLGAPINIIPQGNIGGIVVYATLEETGHDLLQVTEHPVEAGAQITDHAFFRPAELTMNCGWTNSSLFLQKLELGVPKVSSIYGGQMSVSDYVSSIYSQMIALQQSLQPFTVQTSIRQYLNMVITSIGLVRDHKSSQALLLNVGMRQIIFVSTFQATLAPQADQADAPSTSETFIYGINALINQPTPASGGSLPSSKWMSPQP